jgi:hypothetical protein
MDTDSPHSKPDWWKQVIRGPRPDGLGVFPDFVDEGFPAATVWGAAFDVIHFESHDETWVDVRIAGWTEDGYERVDVGYLTLHDGLASTWSFYWNGDHVLDSWPFVPTAAEKLGRSLRIAKLRLSELLARAAARP